VTVLLVALGAALGAPARFLTDRWVQSRHDSVFPWGTFTVNAVGSFILGVVLGGAAAGGVPDPVVDAVGTGFCGALTTYSTFSYETVRLVEDGSTLYAVLNALGSLAVGLLAAAAGVGVAGVLLG
jgi:CrcB protein